MDTMLFPEPIDVYQESSFESAILEVVRTLLQPNSQSVILPRFGLDIAVFTGGSDGRAALIEVKSFNGQRQGGIGFGNPRGKGLRWTFFFAVQSRFRFLTGTCVGLL